MRHKVSELSGVMLDAAVAKALGVEWRIAEEELWVQHVRAQLSPPRSDESVFDPSSDWEDAGPIIERERISIRCYSDGTADALCCAEFAFGEATSDAGYGCGETVLIAAMRCYVASKYGDEVEL